MMRDKFELPVSMKGHHTFKRDQSSKRRLRAAGCWTLLSTGILPHASAAAATNENPDLGRTMAPWMPSVELEDFECRQSMQAPVVNWGELRGQFRELAQGAAGAKNQRPWVEDATAAILRKAAQAEILLQVSLVLLRFQIAVSQCPLGAVTASLFAACMAHLPQEEISNEPLPQPFQSVLADLGQKSFAELVTRDFRVLISLGPLHLVAAAEWSVFSIANMYIHRLQPAAALSLAALSDKDSLCPGTGVAGHTSEKLLRVLVQHVPLASGKDIQGLKFLRGLDPLVTSVMRDPTEFSYEYIPACPVGAAAFSTAAAMLALMSNPSLFERFADLIHYVFKIDLEAVLAGAATWDLFRGLAKLSSFSTRFFDLAWSVRELFPLPSNPQAFDNIRISAAVRGVRLADAAVRHPHEASRSLAEFLLRVSNRQAEQLGDHAEVIIYLSAVGGLPFADHIAAFVQRAMTVQLPGLILACMDQEAYDGCGATAKNHIDRVYCAPIFEGHVVLVKHAFLPVLLSAAVDVVWIDFDTFILRNPTEALLHARDQPDKVLPQRSRIRFGSFLFSNSSDMCWLSKICDPRQQWPINISGDMGYNDDDAGDSNFVGDKTIEVLVTEHWDARCLNNGLFYVRATHRPLVFFTLFLYQLYMNPYTDNQNLFDAFLAHSTLDSSVPAARPLLRYALLDIQRKFGCAEGHTSSVDDLVTFHFWSSDFKTREASDAEVVANGGLSSTPTNNTPMQYEPTLRSSSSSSNSNSNSNSASSTTAEIRLRDGKRRVEKASASKSELFQLFFAQDDSEKGMRLPSAAAEFITRVKAPPPNWKGMCSVTAVGIEDLVDERMVRGDQELIDWEQATKVTASEMAGVPELETHTAPSVVTDKSTGEIMDKESDYAGDARCAGIPLRDWSDAIRWIAVLEDNLLLNATEAAALKSRIRNLDVGCLLMVQAYGTYGSERLARELRAVLTDG